MQYKDWLREWLHTYVKISGKQKTLLRYADIVKQHIGPAVGTYDLNELTPMILQRFVGELLQSGNKKTGKGLSANSVNGIITVLQNSLKTAYTAGIADTYVADKIVRPRVSESRIVCFTRQEQQTIEQAVMHGKQSPLFGVVLCLYTGLRIGELLALTWDDIDMQNKTLSVSKTCYDGYDAKGNFTRIVDTPKTPTSQRTIPLSKHLIELLRWFKKGGNTRYVITCDAGKPIFVRVYQRRFEVLLKRLHIPHKGFHALRHTFATRALECGMDVKTLAEILGHKNPVVTLDRYVHSLTEHKRKSMERLGNMLVFAV